MIGRWERICGGVLLGALAACGSEAAEARAPQAARASETSQRPSNVVLIVLDDVSPGLIGAYDELFRKLGRPSQVPAQTPAIDALLAARGLTFTRAWANPKCTPTRAQILTGRNGFRTGVGQILMSTGEAGSPGLDPKAELLPERLRKAPTPYHSAAVGKWHLSSAAELELNPVAPLGTPPGRWFESYAGSLFNLGEEREKQADDAGYWVWRKFHAGGAASGAELENGPKAPHFSEERATTIHGYPSVDTTDDALALAGSLPEPWFLYVAYNAIHEPLHHVTLALPQPNDERLRAKGACDHSEDSDAAMARCMMSALDSQIGRLVEALDESDTTVILVGDNGMAQRVFLPPYPRHHGKGSLFDGGIEVPLIVRSPTLKPELRGTSTAAPAHAMDLFATVAELAGAPTGGVDAVSLAPLLTGALANVRNELYSERFQPNFVPTASGGVPEGTDIRWHDQALFDGRFKLVRESKRTDDGKVEVLESLYDLARDVADPDWIERRNLLHPDSGPLAAPVAAALTSLRSRLDAAFPSLVR
jgi:arylsulfatase A-like enzyme